MTSYFRPDIKGDALRKEMVLSPCTVTLFFFEQKVSFQMLTKVRCHVILKGRCPRTSEAPKSCHPIISQLASFLQPSQASPKHPFISSCLSSFIQQQLLSTSESRKYFGMKSSETQILSRKKDLNALHSPSH